MKLLHAAPMLALFLLVLGWIPLRAVDTSVARYDRILSTLDRFSTAENALSRDALSARTGMLRNYDPLVRDENALTDLVRILKDAEPLRLDEAAVVDRLGDLVDKQTMLVERFKSDNALLQNSLAYFQLFSARLGASDNATTVSTVMALDAAMLQLTLDTSPAAAQAVADRLEQLAGLAPPPGQADSKISLLAHGGMLHSLLPRTDNVLKLLYAVPIKSGRDALRAILVSNRAASQVWDGRLRLVLYATSLVLFGILLLLARRLRSRAQALRERAAFDHVVARISMRLMSSSPHEIDGRIERSLAELAAGFGAGRAYFLQVDKGVRTHAWCLDGQPLPGGWLDAVPALAAALDSRSSGILHIPQPNRLPRGANRDSLAAAGVSGWLCLTSWESGGTRRFLGFDALGPCRITQIADLGFARLALDVLANAADKQLLEQDRARLATRLQQARRMETVGALASGIAHNFNNLIGAILGYSEMAESQAASGSRIARNLSEIRNAGERARELVDQILDFGRPRHKPRTELRIDALVAEAASLLRASLPHRIELVVPASADPAVILGEHAQLQQVILNLCNNAAQAITGEGRIEIETARRDVGTTLSLDQGALAPGRYVVISVSDNGRGMSEEVARRIFEPFFTTRQTGNGLGLATVKEIVIEHEGAIELRSTPGIGTRFEVWLRCIVPSAVETGAAMRVPTTDGPQTILLLAEERSRLHRDEEILAAIGYEPVGFTQPTDALDACRATPDRFDALIVGLDDPSDASLDFIAHLHEAVPMLPILLATASTADMDASALAASGVDELVGWPLDPTEVASALRRCLARLPAPVEP